MAKSNKSNNSSSNNFNPSRDIVTDIVRYGNSRDGLKDLAASIKARFEKETEGKDESECIAALKESLAAEGLDRRRISETLLSIGIRQRNASEKASAKADALAEKLADIIDQLKELAKANTDSEKEAISALRRAHLSLSGEVKNGGGAASHEGEE